MQSMEEMRLLARARNIDEIWGVATTLYEWQFIHYSKTDELAGRNDFYTFSTIFPCWLKNSTQYTFSDADMKHILSILTSILNLALRQQRTYLRQMIVEPSAIQSVEDQAL